MAKHARRLRLSHPAVWAGVPLGLLLLLVGAFVVDTEIVGGDVVRNVEVAHRGVGGLGDDDLDAALEDYASDLAATPVRLEVGDTVYETTASELGVVVDEAATADRVRDAGRGFVLVRPFRWATSALSPYEVRPVLTVDAELTEATVIALEGEARTAPVEPTLAVDEGGAVVAVPGVPGRGIDGSALAERLPDRMADSDATRPVAFGVDQSAIAPDTDDDAMQALADEANELASGPLQFVSEDDSVEVAPEVVRTWLRAVVDEDGELDLTVDQDATVASLVEVFPDAGNPPSDASFDIVDGVPVIVPGQDGTGCCAPETAGQVLDALRAGNSTVEVSLAPRPPEVGTEQLEGLGVTQVVGGTRAWPESRTDEVGPGFTTFHESGQARVTNIHRIADLVRGALILPGESFSVNQHVGRRTTSNGFVVAGAIRNGEHVDEVGGGVSQFATTLFNAAYFAGLDIDQYQAHTEYFSRYPRGREATMGYPAPDLVITNNTPYGVLIWTSYTGSSLTITMYSTPFAEGEQTGISEGRSGNCTVVTTTRTRTYVDGREPTTDTFRATYRPGEGIFC
jgi:vancomycin resistance protein YoaR